MKEKLSKLLAGYAHKRGGAPVLLTEPAVAEEIADEIEAFLKREAQDEAKSKAQSAASQS